MPQRERFDDRSVGGLCRTRIPPPYNLIELEFRLPNWKVRSRVFTILSIVGFASVVPLGLVFGFEPIEYVVVSVFGVFMAVAAHGISQHRVVVHGDRVELRRAGNSYFILYERVERIEFMPGDPHDRICLLGEHVSLSIEDAIEDFETLCDLLIANCKNATVLDLR